MEGQNEKEGKEIQEGGIPKAVDISQERTEEEFVEEQSDEEYDEGYPGEDYEEDYFEGEGDDWESEAGSGADEPVLGGLYGLFKDVLKKPDTTRVSNLTNEELGVLPISVRGAQWIALIARTFRHNGVANFFDQQANLITTSAMARKGWFSELFITSRRFSSRDSSSSIQNLPQFNKKSKWRVFSEKENQQIQEPIQ